MLTSIEFNVLRFVHDETRKNGFVPSLHEIAAAVNFSHETVRQSLIALDRKGFIRRFADKPRALTVLRTPKKAMLAA